MQWPLTRWLFGGSRGARRTTQIAETNATIGEARDHSAFAGVTMKPYVALLVALICALTAEAAGSLCAAQTQRALLIGINTYQPAGTAAEHPASCVYGRCELNAFQNLDGSVNDAKSMADLLTSAKFGFPPNQVVLLTNPAPPHARPGVTILPASQTTRDGILAAMQKYLVDLPSRATPWFSTTPATDPCASTARATSSPCWSTASMCTPTARWFLLTLTRAATMCATAR